MHSLIVGMTESGKTTLAKQMSRAYKAQGVSVIVMDELRDPGWSADFITGDPREFLNVFWNSRSCAVFIDESGDCVGRYDETMAKTATRGRHWGHNVHYLTQRGAQISKTVRDQCSNLFLFTTSMGDCKIYAAEFNRPELLEGAQLPQFEYMMCPRYGTLLRGTVNPGG